MGKHAKTLENAYPDLRAHPGSAAHLCRSDRFEALRNRLEVVLAISAEGFPKRVFA